jgi:hypothetical protein
VIEPPFLYPNKPIRIFNLTETLATLNPEDWFVQPKWKGDRVIISIQKSGKITMWSRHRRILSRAGDDWNWLDLTWSGERDALLDGQLLSDGQTIYIWDQIMENGEIVTTKRPLYASYDRRCIIWGDLYMIGHNGRTIKSCDNYNAEHWRFCIERHVENPNFEGLVFKRKDATDMWGITETKETPSQLKWRME